MKIQEIKKPSESLTQGKFDKNGNYHPAMFEHLTNEKYFEYVEMDSSVRP